MQYAELMSLAKRDTDADRAGLIVHLANLYLDNPNEPTEIEAQLFGDITSTLMKEVATDICGRIAERLADSHRTPHKLAVDLARSDEHEVYQPILSKSEVLTDTDLVKLISELSEDHSLAVVERPSLSTAVTDALIDTGFSSVQQKVSCHKGASFSQHGLERLLQAAMDDETLLENLSNRNFSDMAQDSAQFFARLKGAVTKVLGSEDTLLPVKDEFSPQRVAEFSKRLIEEVRQEKADRRSAKILAAKINEGLLSIDEVVIDLARSENHKTICQIVASQLDIPLDTVQKAYLNGDTVVISLLCHSLNLSVNAYEAVTRLRVAQLTTAHLDHSALMSRYRNLNRRESQRMLRIVKLNANK